MTLPRPVLIALLGLALCAAAFLATRSANDTGSAVTTTAPITQPGSPAQHAAKPATAGKHGAAAKHTGGPKAHKATPAQHKAAPVDKAAAKPEVKPAAPAQTAKPATPAKPAVSPEVAKTLPAIKALARGDVVVFFFTHAGPADDTGARQAVNKLRGEKGVSVFKADFKDLELFRPVLAGAGVSQVPAIVVVRAGQRGRLVQGFVDARTLRQTVADARR
jgi:hypothetical protein